jgi:single-stranded DNA-binding protein
MFYAQVEGRVANVVNRSSGEWDWLSFGLAHTWKSKNEEKLEWIQCTIWGEQGKQLVDEEVIKKGALIHAAGAITTTEWLTSTGEYRKDVCLRVDELTPMFFDERTNRYYRDTQAKVNTRSSTRNTVPSTTPDQRNITPLEEMTI